MTDQMKSPNQLREIAKDYLRAIEHCDPNDPVEAVEMGEYCAEYFAVAGSSTQAAQMFVALIDRLEDCCKEAHPTMLLKSYMDAPLSEPIK